MIHRFINVHKDEVDRIEEQLKALFVGQNLQHGRSEVFSKLLHRLTVRMPII
jgi:hypothetical protein